MNDSVKAEILFREDQQFRQPLLWVCLVLVSAFLTGTILYMVSRIVPVPPEGLETRGLVGMLVIAGLIAVTNVAVLLLFTFAKLQTEVSTRGLFVRFLPFHRRTRQIDLERATEVEAVEYNPFMEYGGYGIRWRPRGTAYNVAGSYGVYIAFDNGCHLLIGSQRPEELAEAIHQIWTAPEDTGSDTE